MLILFNQFLTLRFNKFDSVINVNLKLNQIN